MCSTVCTGNGHENPVLFGHVYSTLWWRKKIGEEGRGQKSADEIKRERESDAGGRRGVRREEHTMKERSREREA